MLSPAFCLLFSCPSFLLPHWSLSHRQHPENVEKEGNGSRSQANLLSFTLHYYPTFYLQGSSREIDSNSWERLTFMLLFFFFSSTQLLVFLWNLCRMSFTVSVWSGYNVWNVTHFLIPLFFTFLNQDSTWYDMSTIQDPSFSLLPFNTLCFRCRNMNLEPASCSVLLYKFCSLLFPLFWSHCSNQFFIHSFSSKW